MFSRVVECVRSLCRWEGLRDSDIAFSLASDIASEIAFGDG